jgi:RNA polymerase sigma-54 factor
MKQGLQLRFSQSLSLTPQLQQAIKLLQMSTLDLNQEIDALIQTNPLLERGDVGEDEYGNPNETNEHKSDNGPDNLYEQSLKELNNIDLKQADAEFNSQDSSLADVAPVDMALSGDHSEFSSDSTKVEYEIEFSDDYNEFSNGSRWDENTTPDDDDSDFKQQDTLQESLRDHLISQIKLMPLSERDQTLFLILIDSINEDGYLETSLEEIATQLPDYLEIDALELQTALRHIQHLDPAGVGARNLSECLLLQLNLLPVDTPFIALAKLLAEFHLPALGARDFIKIKKSLNCDDESLKSAQTIITKLNPRPGSQFAHIGSEHYIQHEVVVRKVKGIWIASLNDSVIPKLRINQLYAGILKRNRDSSSQYLQSQMQEAKWMIKNIQQRFSTILRVSQAIVDRQRNFLEYGEVAMRPLVLREIADELGLHESTISRVTTHKYMLTPRGIFELKYFFGSSVATEAGGTCSATAIRALIQKLVAEENTKKPYSDNQITQLLSDQGIVVARRTIAKYRESLGIAPASLRKSL